MTEKRKLAAVMFTDIIGYTALMSKDEQKALKTLQKNRDLQKSLAEKHHGEFLKEMGDGTLLCFQSALDAVRCAMEIQKSVKEDPELNLRIGIHLGDIVFKEGDVFGDGVNVASRIERLAEAGKICISEEVYRSVRSQPDIEALFLDEKKLKNVDHPVRIYTLLVGGLSTSQPGVLISKEGDQREKSIIVLPFINISPDPDQEYFSDGLTEEIITDLSHIHALIVISRSSAMTFKGTKMRIREISREVNVQYVLEGSVRKAGKNLRITAKLINAVNDKHLWADKYTGTLDDIFNIQERVSREIVDALKLKLSAEEKQKITDRPIDNIMAYDCYLKANVEIWKFTEESLNRGIRHLQDGLDIMGDNALLYSGMAYAILQLVNIGAKQDKEFAKSKEIAKKALALDPESEKAHAVLGWIALWGNPRQVIHHFQKALSIYPDDAFALQGLAAYHIQVVGGIAEATRILKRLIQIDPLHFATNNLQGLVHTYDGEYKLAIPHFRRTYDLFPDNVIVQFYYAMALAYLGQMDQAFVLIDQIANFAPNNAFSKLGLMLKYAVQKKKDKVFHEMTTDFQKTCLRDITFSHHLAGIFSLTGAKEEALDWLENAVDGGFINYPLLSEKDLFLENIRGELRFKKLMKRLKKECENFEV